MKTKDITTNEGRFNDQYTAEESNAREDFLKQFETELESLIGRAYAEARDIGGQFRAPGIVRDINNIIKDVTDSQ